ncbi:hypothetical protein Spock_130 [Bacillus phage Spock]|uniref:Uncharacterized protein n=2 Tax=Bequatrovirus spock TaxID=1918008 RepID=A0A1X9SFY0_9CAUD|nr:hypothetical protein Spock_130 [Bacillus phage Spock]AGY48530.1 hypothetical protein Spock_130 [Bacillus phage Spock]ARQ95042.1 hypothetical protein FLAPJACK_131 [Bacillus phage Flapjack]
MRDSVLDEAYIQSLGASMAQTILEKLEPFEEMTPEEREDHNTKMYLKLYFDFFKDVYGENPKYDYTRDGNTINVTLYPDFSLDYIEVSVKLKENEDEEIS